MCPLHKNPFGIVGYKEANVRLRHSQVWPGQQIITKVRGVTLNADVVTDFSPFNQLFAKSGVSF